MKLFNWLNESGPTSEGDDSSASSSSEPPPSPALQGRLKELQKISVKEAMIPRALVSALDADVQLRRVKRLKSSKANYFPVYKGDLDHVLGWISKSRVLELLNVPGEEVRLADHVQPVGEVGEAATVAELADQFLASNSPFLVVKSLSGTTAGIVPLSEFVELLFGFELGPSSQPPIGNEMTLLRGYEL